MRLYTTVKTAFPLLIRFVFPDVFTYECSNAENHKNLVLEDDNSEWLTIDGPVFREES